MWAPLPQNESRTAPKRTMKSVASKNPVASKTVGSKSSVGKGRTEDQRRRDNRTVKPPDPSQVPPESSVLDDEETAREVKEMLDRMRARTAVPSPKRDAQLISSQRLQQERQRPQQSPQVQPRQPDIRTAPEASKMVLSSQHSQQVPAPTGSRNQTVELADEESALQLHEARLAEEMALLVRRRTELRVERLESSLREVIARELRAQQQHLHNDLEARLATIASERASEEERLHVLKGDLAASIEELVALYDAACAREVEVERVSTAAAEALTAEVKQRVEAMEASAEKALALRVREEAEANGWLAASPPPRPANWPSNDTHARRLRTEVE